jgi:hypothetical protein
MNLDKLFLVAGLLAASLFFAATPAEAAAELSPCSGGTTTFASGIVSNQYTNPSPPEDQSFDGPATTFVPDSYSNSDGPEVGNVTIRNRLCFGRFNVKNVVDPNYQLTWRQWHDDVGGAGLRVTSKNSNVGDVYIHGNEDGIKFMNCAEDNAPSGSDGCHVQQTGGQWHVEDVAIRNHHDDAIDNDDCMPGSMNNVLIEGHTVISTQEESSSSGACQSTGEGNIHISNSVLRTMPVNAYDGGPPNGEDEFRGGGKWFKWDEKDGTANDHHTVVLTNVLLVVDRKPRSGWDSLDFPGHNNDNTGATTWVGGNNAICYLNTAGETYGGPTPGTQGIPNSGSNAVAFLSGNACKEEFTTRRDAWLASHNCAEEGPNDIDPKNSPMCRIKTGSK